MNAERLVFNGINGTTGRYLQSPLTPEEVSQRVLTQREKFNPKHEYIQELKARKSKPSFRLKPGINPKDLSQTGWGVIFAYDAKPEIREALNELLEHRQNQAKEKYKEFIGHEGYQPEQSKNDFLANHKVGPGAVDPKKMPYYLLIVGDPETIPYSFQCQLDVQYAVGRIYFDTPEEYAQYARSVVEAETGKHSLPRRVSFFGVQNIGDTATQLSADYLVKPLAQWVSQNLSEWKLPNWDVKTILSAQATKAQLSQVLGGTETPSLLFTASHGMGFDIDDSRLLNHQGALLCQDWPGNEQWGYKPIPEDFYFSADDLGNDASLLGLIAFHFACYSAGTPKLNELDDSGTLLVDENRLPQRAEIAPHSFVARLPQRLLGHPNGGALAVVGHVERAWGSSFLLLQDGEKSQQLQVFESAIEMLIQGLPVGCAFDFFNECYAELATVLSQELQDIHYGKKINPYTLSNLWTTTQDSSNYIIMGDPAVRLVIGNEPDSNDTPSRRIEPVILQIVQSTSNPSTTGEITAPKEASNKVLGESDLEQTQMRLNQALEDFIQTAKHRAEQLEAIVSSANSLLEALKKLS